MKNQDGLWKLSPSSLYGYEECPACFWIDQRIGRLPSIPMRLNDAMDERLKNRYDSFRQKGRLPDEIAHLKKQGISLFNDLGLLNEWRSNKTALQLINEKDGYMLEGKIDDLLVTPDGKHIPYDFKSSGDKPKDDKQKYYRLQLHAYALMLREKGFPSADRAYLAHYFTKDREDPSLSMVFDFHLDPVELDLSKFERTMRDVVKLLNGHRPKERMECRRCVWLGRRDELVGYK